MNWVTFIKSTLYCNDFGVQKGQKYEYLMIWGPKVNYSKKNKILWEIEQKMGIYGINNGNKYD